MTSIFAGLSCIPQPIGALLRQKSMRTARPTHPRSCDETGRIFLCRHYFWRPKQRGWLAEVRQKWRLGQIPSHLLWLSLGVRGKGTQSLEVYLLKVVTLSFVLFSIRRAKLWGGCGKDLLNIIMTSALLDEVGKIKEGYSLIGLGFRWDNSTPK